jgi:hypothetical protein
LLALGTNGEKKSEGRVGRGNRVEEMGKWVFGVRGVEVSLVGGVSERVGGLVEVTFLIAIVDKMSRTFLREREREVPAGWVVEYLLSPSVPLSLPSPIPTMAGPKLLRYNTAS